MTDELKPCPFAGRPGALHTAPEYVCLWCLQARVDALESILARVVGAPSLLRRLQGASNFGTPAMAALDKHDVACIKEAIERLGAIEDLRHEK